MLARKLNKEDDIYFAFNKNNINISNTALNQNKPNKRKKEIPSDEDSNEYINNLDEKQEFGILKNIDGSTKKKYLKDGPIIEQDSKIINVHLEKENNNIEEKTENIAKEGNIKYNKKLKHNYNKITNKIKESKKTKSQNKDIFDTFKIENNFDFKKYNITYSNLEENFITEYTKKNETDKTIFLECSIRGRKGKPNCEGKAKFIKETGVVQIYQKCNNDNNIHKSLDFESFKNLYNINNYANIEMTNILYQKYFIECLFLDNKCNNYTDCLMIFSEKFKNIKFLLSEDIVKKIKSKCIGGIKNSTISEVINSLKLINKNMIIDVFKIKSEYLNKNKEIENREQEVFLISDNIMIKYLNYEKGKQFGIDCTFKIVPKSFKPYKLMTIYCIDKEKNNIVLVCLLCLKYNDSESLKKIFAFLNINYNFSPISVTCDFDSAQIKALKQCNFFKKKPYIISCFFHFAQSTVKP